MPNTLKVACVQLTSGPDIQANLDRCAALIREAAGQGARFIVTPENTCHIRPTAKEKLENFLSQDEHMGIPYFSDLANELGITLLIGSMAVKTDNAKLANRSFLFSPDGELKSTYDKIHLFDVQLPSGETHKESDIYNAGIDAVTAKIDAQFQAGLSICYDLRFAYLYRDMAKAGANIMCVPAAFTVSTGKAHWETLLRARAIETGSYVMAAAQVGEHDGGRKTYGHSMIINPWGEVISSIPKGEGLITADLEVEQIHKARSAIPSLTLDRTYKVKHDE